MSEKNIEALFNDCQSRDLDKNSTIMELATRGGLDVTQAVREYQKFAKNAGIVLGTKERTEKVNAMLADADLTNADVRKEMLTHIADTFDVSEATAGAHIRKYAEEAGIELPSQNRNSLEDMVKFVEELISADKSRAEVVEALQNEMGYTANSAASAYSRATRELGISTGRVGTSVPLSELVTYVRENQTMARKDLVQAMHNDLGYAESTANSFLTYVNFAKEWAKQEMAG